MSDKTSSTVPHNRNFSNNDAGNLYQKARENDYWNKITEYNSKIHKLEYIENQK